MIGIIAAASLAIALPPGGVLSGEQAAYDDLVAQQARAADATFGGSPCPNSAVEVVSVTPWKILDHPDLIVWREKVRVTGCGRSSVQNLNAGRLGGSPPWKIVAGLPGDSLAATDLQQNTFPAATAAARDGLSADCATTLGNVYLAALPGTVDFVAPGAAGKPRSGHPQITLPDSAEVRVSELDLSKAWFEVWPFQACGHDRTLGVVFIPMKDQPASIYLFLPVWQQIEAHGPGARPVAVSPPAGSE